MQNTLDNIKTIEASLLQLKARVQQIGKNQLKSMDNIQKTFCSSITVINQKLEECKFMQQKSKILAVRQQMQHTKLKSIQQQKLMNEKQLMKSRQAMEKLKMSQCQLIKSQSIANNRAILQIKNNQLEEKKKNSNMIKYEKEKSRAKIQEYHLQKYNIQKSRTNAFKEAKDKENYQKQKRISKLNKQMKFLSLQQQKLEQRYQQKQLLLKNLKQAVKKVQKMKGTEFLKITNLAGANIDLNNTTLTEENAQKILNQIIISSSADNSLNHSIST